MTPREKIIEYIYRDLLGRGLDDAGRGAYLRAVAPLDVVYSEVYSSEEALEYRDKLEQERIASEVNPKLPITLAMFVKDAEASVEMAIKSVLPIVSEVVVTDTGSIDKTVEICKDLGARVYKVGFSDFGSIRTVAGHLARQPWVLGLDSDETILQEDLSKFRSLIYNSSVDVWGLPRKRWLDLEMTQQVEGGVYPDLQFRLFRNKPEIYYTRRVHEKVVCGGVVEPALDGPCIQHFQDVFKSGEKLKTRNQMYIELYNKDIAGGVVHEGLAVQPLDEV